MDFLLKIIVEAQRIALHLESPSIQENHLKAAYDGPIFTENRNLIRGLADKDITRLSRSNDIPTNEFLQMWAEAGFTEKTETEKKDQNFNPFQTATKGTKTDRPSAEKHNTKYKRSQTRKENVRTKNAQLNESLPDEDERQKRGIGLLLEELEVIKDKSSQK